MYVEISALLQGLFITPVLDTCQRCNSIAYLIGSMYVSSDRIVQCVLNLDSASCDGTRVCCVGTLFLSL